ncbi:MAG: phosphoribosylanthranilate isomerase [Solirubrobacterales bacterium]
MKVKICGITRLEDAEAAVSAGAWAVGLNHSSESPRQIDLGAAEEIGRELQRRCEVAGVFVNAPIDDIVLAVERERLTLVQLHGEEGPSFCAEVARKTGCKVIKAFRVKNPGDVAAARAYRTDFHLLDAYARGAHGGTGTTFDWELASRDRSGVPVILAGGLDPDNVADAIDAAWPWAVDVASGVEIEPGIKDPNRIVSFIEAAKRAGAVQQEVREHRRAIKQVRREVERRTRTES